MKKLILPCLMLVALVLLVYAATGTTTCILKAQCYSEIAAIKARGEPTSMSDFADSKIPREHNAALIYLQALDALDGPTRDHDFTIVIDNLLSQEYERTPRVWSDAEAVVRRYDKSLALASRAGRFPECRFPLDWASDAGPKTGHLWGLRELGALIRTRALVEARDGKTRSALASIEVGIRMGEALRNEPGITSHYARASVIRAQCRCLREVLGYGAIDEADACRLYDILEAVDLVPGLLRAAREQRAIGFSYFENVSKKGLVDVFGDVYATWIVEAYRPGRPTIYADEKEFIRYVNPMVADMSFSYREHKLRGLHSFDKPVLTEYAVVSDALLGAFCSARLSTDEATAEIGAARIALALEAYRSRRGSYPESLDELRLLGWRLPKDPFSGRGFVYRRQGKGFLLYSIGMNLKDDGGRSYDRPPQNPEKPPPGWEGSGAVIPETPPASGVGVAPSAPAVTPPTPKKPKPPFSTREMRYKTADGRRSEDIIWQMER